jgi:hypothetical protein
MHVGDENLNCYHDNRNMMNRNGKLWHERFRVCLTTGTNHNKLLFIIGGTLIDDVLSLRNSRFGDFVDRICPIGLEIKDTTDTDRCASYLDIHLEIDSEGQFRTKHYAKRDDFNLPIVNFPSISRNILAAPAYGIYISVKTKGAIRIRISKTNRQHNGKKKDKMTNNDLQSIHIKLKIE